MTLQSRHNNLTLELVAQGLQTHPGFPGRSRAYIHTLLLLFMSVCVCKCRRSVSEFMIFYYPMICNHRCLYSVWQWHYNLGITNWLLSWSHRVSRPIVDSLEDLEPTYIIIIIMCEPASGPHLSSIIAPSFKKKIGLVLSSPELGGLLTLGVCGTRASAQTHIWRVSDSHFWDLKMFLGCFRKLLLPHAPDKRRF